MERDVRKEPFNIINPQGFYISAETIDSTENGVCSKGAYVLETEPDLHTLYSRMYSNIVDSPEFYNSLECEFPNSRPRYELSAVTNKEVLIRIIKGAFTEKLEENTTETRHLKRSHSQEEEENTFHKKIKSI